ncbi:glycosyltransferase family 4 protein [Sphingobium sp. CR28]|uniref:glycosyltransferase family 4 protein n=1 Tax=Sphingobium sp. CR28 TaxID=3400272 RepID=UPI003FEE3128
MAPESPSRIIGIISFFNVAGAPQALMRVARQLRARGHEMEIWFLYRKAGIELDREYVRVFIDKARPSVLDYALLPFRLLKALRAAKPTAVLSFLPLGNVMGQAAATLAGVPNRVASQRSPGTTYGRVMRLADRIAGTLPIYRTNICVSDVVRQSFRGYSQSYRRKLRVVHNGIEWSASPSSRLQARVALGLPEDRFLFAALGRVDTQKNYGLLIDAMAGSADAILAIAGDGPLMDEMRSRAKNLGVEERVIFLGALGRAQVADLLCAADAFVQSSLFEGQSNSVLEAMHAGLPMILSDIPEQRETIVDSQTGEEAGLLVPLGDVNGWRTALNRIASDAGLRERLGELAHALVNRQFTLEQMIDGFEAALAERKPKSSHAG